MPNSDSTLACEIFGAYANQYLTPVRKCNFLKLTVVIGNLHAVKRNKGVKLTPYKAFLKCVCSKRSNYFQ